MTRLECFEAMEDYTIVEVDGEKCKIVSMKNNFVFLRPTALDFAYDDDGKTHRKHTCDEITLPKRSAWDDFPDAHDLSGESYDKKVTMWLSKYGERLREIKKI